MKNFITNSNTANLRNRLIELIQKSDELKFLVGFFYFSGIRELYKGLKEKPDQKIKVLVGLNVDSTNLEESVAEKLKPSISRLTPAIRDYYDLWHFIKTGFDFSRPEFLKMVNEKLRLDGYERDFSHNLGLSDSAIQELKRTIKIGLAPMIRANEQFDLDKVLVFFNKLFGKTC